MTMASALLATTLALPLAGSAFLPLWRGRHSRHAGKVAAAAVALALICVVGLLAALGEGESPALSVAWIPTLDIHLALRLDWLAFPFLLNIVVVTLLAIVYGWGYLHVDARLPAFHALLLLFMGGMVGTVLADDLFLFFVFWELMLVASCALIAVWGEGEQAGRVALKYFIFTQVGSLLVLIGLIALYVLTGTSNLTQLRAALLDFDPRWATALVMLFAIGFSVKMAVFPLHTWLPDAHSVAPMPITVMLAAAMLSMGVYGLLRFPLSLIERSVLASLSLPLMIAGVVSQFYGALMALAEEDIKRIIAYSSVSQMGYALFGLGTLSQQGLAGAAMHMVNQGIVKALLFMGVGLVMRATGRRRISELGGLRHALPLTAIGSAVGALAITGSPPFCAFHSEWLIFAGAFSTPYTPVTIVAMLAPVFTAAYALWFVRRIFLDSLPEQLETTAPPRAMIVPFTVLACLALLVGLYPAPLYEWVMRAVSTMAGGS